MPSNRSQALGNPHGFREQRSNCKLQNSRFEKQKTNSKKQIAKTTLIYYFLASFCFFAFPFALFITLCLPKRLNVFKSS